MRGQQKNTVSREEGRGKRGEGRPPPPALSDHLRSAWPARELCDSSPMLLGEALGRSAEPEGGNERGGCNAFSLAEKPLFSLRPSVPPRPCPRLESDLERLCGSMTGRACLAEASRQGGHTVVGGAASVREMPPPRSHIPPLPPKKHPPSPLSSQAYFRGDAPHLLDRLVQACQQKTVNAPLPGYGRELQPVCNDWLTGADCGALGAALEAPRKAQQQPHHQQHKKRAPASPQRRRSAEQPQAVAGYACPSFSAAPKPEALPMPTSSLMTRALQCRRSPSPPKCHPVAVFA